MPKGNSAIPRVGGGGGFVPRQPMPQGGLPPQGGPSGFQPVQPRPGPWPPVPQQGFAPQQPPQPQQPQGAPGMVPPMAPSDTFQQQGQQFNPYPGVPVQTQGMLSHLGQQRGFSPEQLQRLFAMMSRGNSTAGGR